MSYHFTGQHESEEVLVVTRPHWIVFGGKAVECLLALAVPFIIWALLRAFYPTFTVEAITGILRLCMILYLYGVWTFFFLSWAHYWFDVSIVTTERIVKVEQYSIFRREISEFRISRVQDVTVEIRGVLATLMKFGDLKVLTASEEAGFVFKRIPEPEKIKDIILQHQGKVAHV